MSQEAGGVQEIQPSWVQRLGARLKEWSAIKEPDMPHFKFVVALGRHVTEEDFRDFEEQFKQCDICLLESYGVSMEQLKLLRDLSAGKRDRWQVTSRGHEAYVDAQMEMLYKSNKAIGVIDITRATAIKWEVEKFFNKARRTIVGWGKSNDFIQLIQWFGNESRDTAEYSIKRREEEMMKNLGPTLKEVLEAYPHLKDKKELMVLIRLGSSHTSFWHKLKKHGMSVERVFGGDQPDRQVYSFVDEATRRFVWGLPITDELLARGILEAMVGKLPEIYALAEANDQQMVIQLRKLVDRYSYDEIKNIFDRVSKNGEGFRQVLDESLKLKGLKLPDMAVTRVRR